MLNNVQAYRLMPWTWSVAWLLTGAGVAISDIYSSPSRGLVAYIGLSAAGWTAAGVVTASTSRNEFGTAVRLVAWAVAYLAATFLGLMWLYSWNIAYFGPIVAVGVAGAIGGIFNSARSSRWRPLSAVLMGLTFLLFAAIAFYISYFMTYFYSPMAELLGDAGASVTSWGLPAGLGGLEAGFVARWILGVTATGPTSLSN